MISRLLNLRVLLIALLGVPCHAAEIVPVTSDATTFVASDQASMTPEQFTRDRKILIIKSGKLYDAGDFTAALKLLNDGMARHPQDEALSALKGKALYRLGFLDKAEEQFREALRIDPFNKVAKEYIAEIRTTSQAQTSTELAEWISIAKDKVGDFIVTFLALFAAFLVNSGIKPVTLGYRLRRARHLVEQGHYDEFTDLIEGLLDEEQFAPLRKNFQFLLLHRSYEEAQEILNDYVNTLDRLPTLLRILEREHEKLETA